MTAPPRNNRQRTSWSTRPHTTGNSFDCCLAKGLQAHAAPRTLPQGTKSTLPVSRSAQFFGPHWGLGLPNSTSASTSTLTPT